MHLFIILMKKLGVIIILFCLLFEGCSTIQKSDNKTDNIIEESQITNGTTKQEKIEIIQQEIQQQKELNDSVQEDDNNNSDIDILENTSIQNQSQEAELTPVKLALEMQKAIPTEFIDCPMIGSPNNRYSACPGKCIITSVEDLRGDKYYKNSSYRSWGSEDIYYLNIMFLPQGNYRFADGSRNNYDRLMGYIKTEYSYTFLRLPTKNWEEWSIQRDVISSLDIQVLDQYDCDNMLVESGSGNPNGIELTNFNLTSNNIYHR